MFCGVLVMILTAGMPLTWGAEELAFDARTVLVYENQTGSENHQFVVRIARFQPDILFEWESFNHQGTVHLRKKAVAEAKRLTVGGLFEAGVDIDSKDVMTNWLSTRMYQFLVEAGETEVQLNRKKIRMRLVGEEHRQVVLNKVQIEVPVVRVEDSDRGSWLVYRDPQNPVLIEYQSRHYHMQLKRISTSKSNNLRWIKKLPPVK